MLVSLTDDGAAALERFRSDYRAVLRNRVDAMRDDEVEALASALAPLDALSVGARVLASDIPVPREVLGDAVEYFPAADGKALEALIDGDGRASEKGRARAAAFRWDLSASRMMKILEEAVGVPGLRIEKTPLAP